MHQHIEAEHNSNVRRRDYKFYGETKARRNQCDMTFLCFSLLASTLHFLIDQTSPPPLVGYDATLPLVDL